MGIDDMKTVFAEGSTYSALPSRWVAMFNDVKTVATQSAQVWLDKDLEALGWYRGEGRSPLSVCRSIPGAALTHTLATERAWRQGRADKVQVGRLLLRCAVRDRRGWQIAMRRR